MLIVKLICLVLGTALTALFILFALRGRKEDWRIEGVPQKEFSDKELWAAGFAMQQLPVFSMDSAVGKKMMSASAIAGAGVLCFGVHGRLHGIRCADRRCGNGGRHLFQRCK